MNNDKPANTPKVNYLFHVDLLCYVANILRNWFSLENLARRFAAAVLKLNKPGMLV